MEAKVRTMLAAASSCYTDAEVALAIDNATLLVAAYTNASVDGDDVLEMCVCRIAVVMLNRRNSEGLASTSAAGVTEAYNDIIPAEVRAVLNRCRRVRCV